MNETVLIAVLAIVGICETTYLIRKRLASQKPVCPIGGGCNVVLMSSYSRLFGIPNDLLGLAFYVGVACMAGLLLAGVGLSSLWYRLLDISVILGSLMSLFLTYLQWQVIKAWCFWCVMSACTIWLMGVILFLFPY